MNTLAYLGDVTICGEIKQDHVENLDGLINAIKKNERSEVLMRAKAQIHG